MIEQIFTLLSSNPTLSLSIIGGLLLTILIVYRKLIEKLVVEYVKKEYGLFNEEEIKTAVEKSETDNAFYTKVSDKLTPTMAERVIKILKTKNG